MLPCLAYLPLYPDISGFLQDIISAKCFFIPESDIRRFLLSILSYTLLKRRNPTLYQYYNGQSWREENATLLLRVLQHQSATLNTFLCHLNFVSELV